MESSIKKRGDVHVRRCISGGYGEECVRNSIEYNLEWRQFVGWMNARVETDFDSINNLCPTGKAGGERSIFATQFVD